MIRRQYRREQRCYFNNFIENQHELNIFYHNLYIKKDILKECLKPYKATLGKSKLREYDGINVKWHDKKLYTMFLLRWS